MAAFHDVRFPDDIAMGAVGGPGFRTDIVEFQSGREQRNIRWSQSRMAWDVAQAIKTQDEMDRLIAFFRNRKGRAYGFRFKDWTDYKCSRRWLATGDGVTKEYQLAKHYALPGTVDHTNTADQYEKRIITRPVPNTLKIWINGVASVAWTCNWNTGRVMFTDAPANGAVIEAEFEFDVPCRFDIDQMKYSMDDYNIYSWGNIIIVELKEGD